MVIEIVFSNEVNLLQKRISKGVQYGTFKKDLIFFIINWSSSQGCWVSASIGV